jgi:hypothetical protein
MERLPGCLGGDGGYDSETALDITDLCLETPLMRIVLASQAGRRFSLECLPQMLYFSGYDDRKFVLSSWVLASRGSTYMNFADLKTSPGGCDASASTHCATTYSILDGTQTAGFECFEHQMRSFADQISVV